MQITFDTTKDAANIAKHGVSLADAAYFEWDGCVSWLDARNDYAEQRECAIGYIGDRLYFIVFVDRENARRVISLRKANKREERRYAST
jgi:uncharacterized protein